MCPPSKFIALLAIICCPALVCAQKIYKKQVLYNGFHEGKQVRNHTTLYSHLKLLPGNIKLTEGFIMVDRLVEYATNVNLHHYATYTYPDTLLTFCGTTVKGKKDGTFFSLLPGNIFYLYTYQNNELHGEFKGFYNIGQLYCKGYYENGKQAGEYRQYYANGKLALTQRMPNNIDNLSHMTYYYVSGPLESKGSYYQEKKVNEWYYYNKQGELLKTEYYTPKGRLIKVKVQ